MIRLVWAAAWYQLVFLRRNPDRLLPLVNVPLLTAAFLAIVLNSNRPELAGYAVFGSAVIGIWLSALFVSGDIIEADRNSGVLEAVTATPAPLPLIVLGRNGMVAAVGFVGLLESVLVAELVFRVHVTVHHKGLLVATLAVTWLAMTGTATMMSGLFVLARVARSFQNSLSYPIYLLSGAMVPLALLPSWLTPVSRFIFLSWVFDLLRDSLRTAAPSHPWPRLAVVAALGAAGFAVGYLLIQRILRRQRSLGVIGFQ